ncbi:ATP-binding protein [Schinkia sp. CFF1]
MKSFLSKSPIKWRITIWTAMVLFFLFTFFAVFQYFFMKNWVIGYEKMSINEKMREVQAFLLEKKDVTKEGIARSRSFFENINEKNELIKIEDQKGNTLLIVSNGLSIEGLPYIAVPNEITSSESNADHYLVYRKSLMANDFKGTIEIVRKLENYTRLFNYMFTMMIIAIIGAILLSSMGGFLIANQILKPIKALSTTMQKIKANGLKERVPEFQTKDELTALTHIFNGMMDDLEVSFDKQKRFVEDASHELRTPISILEGHLSMLQRWGKRDEEVLDESIEASLHEVKRLKDLVNDLLEITRVEETRYPKEVFNPIYVIDNVIKSFAMVYPHFIFSEDYKKVLNLQIYGVRRHFEQLLIIIIDNAIKYSQSLKKIDFKSEVQKQKLFIHIIDHGEGIPKEDLPYIFDRFYRVDKARSRAKGGNGLGLSIAKEIVESLEGTITIISDLGKGTRVTLCFHVYQNDN